MINLRGFAVDVGRLETAVRRLSRSELPVYGLTTAVSAGLPFFLLPFLVKRLTPEEYGLVAIFQILTVIAAIGVGWNMEVAVARDLVLLEPEHRWNYLGTVAIGTGALFALAGVATTVLGSVMAPLATFPRNWLWAVVLSAALQQMVTLCTAYLQMMRLARAYALVRILQAVVEGGLSIFLVFVCNQGWRGRVLGNLAATALMAALTLAGLFRWNGSVRPRFRPEFFRRAVRLGFPVVPHSAAAYCLTWADRFIISHRLGVNELGIYSVAAQAAMGFNLLCSSVNLAWVPWLYRALAASDATGRVNRQVVRRIYLLHVLYVAGVVIYGTALMVAFRALGQPYRSAIIVLPLLTLGVAFNGMYKTVTNFIFYSGRTVFVSACTFTSAAVSLPLSWLLVGSMGLLGASAAFATGNMLLFGLTWIMSNRVYPMPYASVLREFVISALKKSVVLERCDAAFGVSNGNQPSAEVSVFRK